MTLDPRFAALFQPGRIGKMTLKNRIFMPPMGDRYGRDGFVTENVKDYYEARARGGAGMIIVGANCVEHHRGGTGPVTGYIDDDKFIAGLAELAGVIKKHGARAAIQLLHAGGCAQSSLQPVSASEVPHYPGYQTPHSLTVPEIGELELRFVDAAERAMKAGFDAVEVHGAHGWLLSEFLSGHWNKRKDDYGGSVEARARFLLEIVRGIKERLGQDYPVWARINCEEPDLDGGITLDEARQIARMLVDAGSDAVHVSRDPHSFNGVPSFGPACVLLPLAEVIKKTVEVPILAAGWVPLDQAEPAVSQGRTDFIGLGRTMIADPDLPNKLASGRAEDVIACIHCNRCLGERKTWDIITSLGGVRCSVNATTGRERQSVITPAEKARNILVVGGGPAGMEAARVAALRGHRVTLYEEREELGGTLPIAAAPPFKDDIGGFTRYLAGQVRKLSVDVHLGRRVTPQLVDEMKPDVVILATGASPFMPDVPGIEQARVVQAESVLDGKAKVGQRVVVIGAESVGCETAEVLADQGKQVTVTRRGPEIATNENWTVRRALLIRLERKGVAALTGVSYRRLTDRGLLITTSEGTEQLIEADTVVIATGARPRSELYEALRDRLPEVYRIGDCVQPRYIMDAVTEAYDVARSI